MSTTRSAILLPAADVLSRETGHDRPYGRTPYAGYDSGDGPIGAAFRESVDARLPATERVAAVRHADASVAYPFPALREACAVNDTVGDCRSRSSGPPEWTVAWSVFRRDTRIWQQARNRSQR